MVPARVAATDSLNELLPNTAAWNNSAKQSEEVTGAPARVNLYSAAYAAPAHCIVVIVAACSWEQSALIMQ